MSEYVEMPKLRAIPGTNLAYILTPSGVKNQNGYQAYNDYLLQKWVGRNL